jgi:hypothetical protein
MRTSGRISQIWAFECAILVDAEFRTNYVYNLAKPCMNDLNISAIK